MVSREGDGIGEHGFPHAPFSGCDGEGSDCDGKGNEDDDRLSRARDRLAALRSALDEQYREEKDGDGKDSAIDDLGLPAAPGGSRRGLDAAWPSRGAAPAAGHAEGGAGSAPPHQQIRVISVRHGKRGSPTSWAAEGPEDVGDDDLEPAEDDLVAGLVDVDAGDAAIVELGEEFGAYGEECDAERAGVVLGRAILASHVAVGLLNPFQLYLGCSWLARQRRPMPRDSGESATVLSLAQLTELEYRMRLIGGAHAANIKAMLDSSGIRQKDLLHAEWGRGELRPAHFLCVDHERKTLFVVICGTKHAGDWLRDMAAAPVMFARGYAHSGMAHAAERLAEDLSPQLCTAASRWPTYSIEICGHSMGAGIGSLVGLLWRGRFEQLHVTAFAPPPSMSADLAASTHSMTTSIVYNEDMVPRMSLDNLRRLVVVVRETRSAWTADLYARLAKSRPLKALSRARASLRRAAPVPVAAVESVLGVAGSVAATIGTGALQAASAALSTPAAKTVGVATVRGTTRAIEWMGACGRERPGRSTRREARREGSELPRPKRRTVVRVDRTAASRAPEDEHELNRLTEIGGAFRNVASDSAGSTARSDQKASKSTEDVLLEAAAAGASSAAAGGAAGAQPRRYIEHERHRDTLERATRTGAVDPMFPELFVPGKILHIRRVEGTPQHVVYNVSRSCFAVVHISEGAVVDHKRRAYRGALRQLRLQLMEQQRVLLSVRAGEPGAVFPGTRS